MRERNNHLKIIAHIRTRGNTASVCVYCGSSELISLFFKSCFFLYRKTQETFKKFGHKYQIDKGKGNFLSVEREGYGIYVEEMGRRSIKKRRRRKEERDGEVGRDELALQG